MLSMSRLAAKQRAARGTPLRPVLASSEEGRSSSSPSSSSSSSRKGCSCSGHVREVLKDGSAWLLPHHQIDHPAAEKNFGSIFMPAESFSKGSLEEGDRVVFRLVVADAEEEGQGQELRAEACRLKRDVVVRMRDAPLWLLDDSDDEDALVERNLDLALSSSSSTVGSTTVGGDSVSEQGFLSECEEEPEPDCEEPEAEAAAAETTDDGLPSVGSALHEAGLCVPCGFFMWGCCSKGKDCNKCHCQHVSLFNCCGCGEGDDE